MKVLVFGTFDHLHPGHLFFLQEAEKEGELHIALARDVTVEKLKGFPPRQGEVERMRAIEEAFTNAHVFLGDTKDYLVPVRKVKPDLILLGYDQELPPGVTMEDLPCPIKRVEPHKPEKYKSSLM